MRASPLAFSVLLAGCKGCQEEETWSPNLEVLDATAVGAHVGEGYGSGTVTVPYFAVNALGAAVPSEALQGSGSVDGFGWGEVEVAPSAHELVPVTASVEGAVATGYAYGLPSMGLHGDRALVPWGAATQLTSAGEGVAWVDGATVWWATPDGDAPPVKVLDVSAMEDGITRIYGAAIDADGVGDLVVATNERVILLRGRSGGGLVWGTGAWASFGTIGAVGLGDLDGDGDTDVMVAVNADVDSVVAFLVQDEVWSFVEAEGMATGFNVYGVSAQDYDRSGDAELTVLTVDHFVRRFGLYEGSWISATSADLDVGMGEGAWMPPSRDVTGDGEEDVIVTGPKGETSSLNVLSFAGGPVIYPAFASSNEPEKLSLDVAEVTGDGATDLFMGTDGGLVLANWSTSSGTLSTRKFEIEQALDGVAVVDVNGDAVTDVALLSGLVRVAPGIKDETNAWNVDVERGLSYDFDMSSTPILGDVTADGVPDLVGYRDAGSGPILQVLRGRAPADASPETLLAGTNAAYGAAAVARDLAVCGAKVWSLVEVEGTGMLYAYDVDADGNLDGIGEGLDVGTGYQLACGDFAEGAVVQVMDANGGVRAWDALGVELSADGLGSAWRDIAAVHQDGETTLTGCDCQLSVGDVDGDGDDDVLAVNADETVLSIGDVTWTLPGATTGVLSDADADGFADVVLQSGDGIAVWRVIGGRVAPGVGRWVQRGVTGVSGFGDLDQDGLEDLFVVGSEGALVYLSAR